MEFILASPPEHVKNALLWGEIVAHMAYKTCGSHLYRSEIPRNLRRGYMLLADVNTRCDFNHERAVEQIISECKNRSYYGVICDFSEDCGFAPLLMPHLHSELKRKRLRLYASEHAARYVRGCNVVIPAAMSGGSLKQRLREAVYEFGADMVVLDVEMICRDFTLPSKDGEGQRLTKQRMCGLLERNGGHKFFSGELYCNYFSYNNQGAMHFALYDDKESVLEKIKLAESFGIKRVIFYYPEMDYDILDACMKIADKEQ